MIVHLVLFNPKTDVSPDRRQQFIKSLEDTCRQIESVRRAVVGRKTEIDIGYSRMFGEKTYEYAAVIEFDDAQGLVQYLEHPLHVELGRLFWELCESTVVLECQAVDARTDDVSQVLG